MGLGSTATLGQDRTFKTIAAMSVLSALCEFATLLISLLQRMAGLTGRTAARRSMGEWPVGAACV
ncbi:hypothetical protein RB2150_08448 [Rhodobacterales bacterium HTCC2150]|nr:hypothetical protein RB2150_08448 [Rhodobacterales bacterium HTCC2150] [Rhodobacteraceae bacterium HTCC2150]